MEVLIPSSVGASATTSGQRKQYYSPRIRNEFSDLIKSSLLNTSATEFHAADIGYRFDEPAYRSRRNIRLQTETLRSDLPAGWPRVLEGPLVWTASDFPDETKIVYSLADDEMAEISQALTYFKGLNRRGHEVDRSSFPLPRLGKTLLRLRDDLYHGRGFATLRGLDVEAFSEADLVTVYLGITGHIAETRGKQTHEGVMMINVVNVSDEMEKENAMIDQPFHTDLVCDVLAILAKSCGADGSTGIVTSAWTVYNELAATRPDLIHVLAEPNWAFDTFGRDPPYYLRPLLYFEGGKLFINFSRRCLVGHEPFEPRSPGIPGLTEAQAEAMDTLEAIGRKHEIKQPMVKGDIRFINNLGLMHRRDRFRDNPDNRRHLLRLWLHNREKCWQLPSQLQLAWERVFRDQDRQEHWYLAKLDETGRRFYEPVWTLGPKNPQPPPQPTVPCD